MRTSDAAILEARSGEQMLELRNDQRTLEFAPGGEGKLPRVSMVAYTGGLMRTPLFNLPVIVNLKGLDIGDKSRPLLRDHDQGREVGYTTDIEVRDGALYIEGVISAETEDAKRITTNAKNGFPWQASIGVPFFQRHVEFVRGGTSVKVNGREFRGPLYVINKSKFREASIVTLGADDDSETRIAAQRQGGGKMDFERWLRAAGWDPDELSDKQTETLKAAWKRETQGSPDPKKTGEDVDPDEVDDGISDLRARFAAETKRIGEIQMLCAGYPTIEAEAIEKGWSPTKAELEVLKAGRPSVNGITRPSNDSPKNLNEQTLEAALMGTLGFDDETRTKIYGEKTLEAAHQFSGIGLQELAMLSCRMGGQDLGQVWGDGEKWIRAAFSTNSLSNILENVLNKQALIAYKSAEIQALKIAKVSRTPDFKQVSRLRLLGTGRYEKLGAGGEIPSGKMTDEKYTNQADTYGQVIYIDRQTMINDDLQMLQDAGTLLGHSGREVLNDLVFALVLSNPNNFFHADNANLSTGAGSAFGETGLKNALIKFRKQKAGPGDKARDKRPINIAPSILLVPPELEVDAQILLGSSDIRPDGGADRGNFNPWRGRYTLVSAPHLSDSYYSGNSAAAWYLLADPKVLPAIEILALNGKVEPTTERVAVPGNQLGVGFRGYIDVGANVMDPKGAVKSAGS